MLHRLFIVADKRDVARTQFWEVSPEWPAAITPIRLAIEASERGAHALPRGLNRSDDSIALRGGIDMFRGIATLTLSFYLAAVAAPAALADNGAPITEQEAHAIGVDAYVYLYPLITMDITRRQLTNTDKGFGRGPMNAFSNVPAYPPASDRTIVRTNYDTLYSIAYLDMLKEPVVVSVPDTAGRYYLLPMLDMWTDVFASPGWRTTGPQAGTFLVTPPGWRPDLRDRFIDEFRLPKTTQRIDAPTPYVWIIGRTKTDGPPDYEAVNKIQAGLKVASLSEWGKAVKPVEQKIDASVDTKTPPKVQVDTMQA